MVNQVPERTNPDRPEIPHRLRPEGSPQVKGPSRKQGTSLDCLERASQDRKETSLGFTLEIKTGLWILAEQTGRDGRPSQVRLGSQFDKPKTFWSGDNLNVHEQTRLGRHLVGTRPTEPRRCGVVSGVDPGRSNRDDRAEGCPSGRQKHER